MNQTDCWGRPVCAYMVKQFVARVQTTRGLRFNVFTSGDDRYYVFDPLDADGCSLCQSWPVLRARLRPDVRRALAHRHGNVDEADWAREKHARHERTQHGTPKPVGRPLSDECAVDGRRTRRRRVSRAR